jgi:hypothetical protein
VIVGISLVPRTPAAKHARYCMASPGRLPVGPAHERRRAADDTGGFRPRQKTQVPHSPAARRRGSSWAPRWFWQVATDASPTASSARYASVPRRAFLQEVDTECRALSGGRSRFPRSRLLPHAMLPPSTMYVHGRMPDACRACASGICIIGPRAVPLIYPSVCPIRWLAPRSDNSLPRWPLTSPAIRRVPRRGQERERERERETKEKEKYKAIK